MSVLGRGAAGIIITALQTGLDKSNALAFAGSISCIEKTPAKKLTEYISHRDRRPFCGADHLPDLPPSMPTQ
jgi:hypothetical protein